MVPKVRMVDGGEDGDCTRAEAEAGPGVLELSRPRRAWICRLCGKIRTWQRKLSIHKCDHHRHPKQSIYSCLFSVYRNWHFQVWIFPHYLQVRIWSMKLSLHLLWKNSYPVMQFRKTLELEEQPWMWWISDVYNSLICAYLYCATGSIFFHNSYKERVMDRLNRYQVQTHKCLFLWQFIKCLI